MAKRKDLRSKLKASDRRRQRRPVAVTSTNNATESLDVTGLLVETILTTGTNERANDAVVLAALRGCLSGLSPSGQASELYGRLQEISRREEVGQRAFRAAVEQLLQLSDRRDDKSNQSDPFVNYLSLLAS